MLILSSAAYSNTPQYCLKSAMPQAKITKMVEVNCTTHSLSICAGYVGVSPSDKAVFIAFRGTHGFIQLIVEGEMTVWTAREVSPIGGRVSSYFLNVFNELWNNGLHLSLLALKLQYPTYQLWVTGHSLGGSLASIGAAVIVQDGIYGADQVQYVTFGQPRTGDSDYAKAHDKLIPNGYRVTHARDLVPHVPPENFEGYFHHQNEVWYDNAMNPGDPFVLCQGDEADKCSDQDNVDYSILDHLYYFGIFLSQYGRVNCTH
jgi:predicted lipase